MAHTDIMSDSDTDISQTPPDELHTLKARADLMGVSYHPSIGLEKLREKVNATVNGVGKPGPEGNEAPVAKEKSAAQLEDEVRLHQMNEATKLIRIRLTCMNPNKKELDGEIFTVGNSVVGTLKKFVPFNNEEGWHIPHMLYEVLRDRECQIFFTKTDARGNKFREGKLIKEFAIEVLPMLTHEELQELAQRQAMAKSID